MRKKTLRTRIMSGLLALVFLASLLYVPLPAEAKATTQTFPVTIGGQTYNVTPGQWVTVNTPGGSTSYNVRFVDGKPVALEMSQYQQIVFGNSGNTTGTNTGSTSSATASGKASYSEFQQMYEGYGLSSEQMQQAYNNYLSDNSGTGLAPIAKDSGSTSSQSGKTNGSSSSQSGKTNGSSSSSQSGKTNGSSSSSSQSGKTNGSSSSSQSGKTNSGNTNQTSGKTSTTSTTNGSNGGQMSWNEFQKANAGKGMSSSEMSQAYQNYKNGNTGTTGNGSTGNTAKPQTSVAEGTGASGQTTSGKTNSGKTNSGNTGNTTSGKTTSGKTNQTTSGNTNQTTSGNTNQTTSGNTNQTTSGNTTQSSTPSTTSGSNSGKMSWNEFQKANAGKGMSSSEMSQAYQNYKNSGATGATNSGSTGTTGSTGSTSTPQTSVTEGATTTSGNNAQSSQTTKTSNWDPTKHPRDPQTGKFISHEEAIARGLMDPADATTNTNSSQTTQSTETSGNTTQPTENSGNTAQSSQTTETASAKTDGATTEKGKTSIGDKFKSGYETGKGLTKQGFQNVKDSLKSGFSAKNILVTAGITVGVDVATQIMRGEQPSLKKALQTVCCAEFVGSVVGSTLGAAAGSFFTPFLSCIPVVGGALSALAPTFGSVVGSAVGAYTAGDLKNGRFSIKEAFKRIDWVGVTGQAIGSTVGAALGSCLGPVGTVIGGMVGGYFGNWAAQKIAGLFGKGNANLPSITMPTGKPTGVGTTVNSLTLGGNDVTSVVISDTMPVEEPAVNNAATDVVITDQDSLDAAYEEYTAYYTEYSKLIQEGKQAEAIEVAEKMTAAKAKYDAIRASQQE